MIWKVKVSSIAEKYYQKLDNKTKKRIKSTLLNLSEIKNPLDYSQVKPLTGELKGFYRLRTGKYRIIFSLLKKRKIIAVVNIFPRGDAYK